MPTSLARLLFQSVERIPISSSRQNQLGTNLASTKDHARSRSDFLPNVATSFNTARETLSSPKDMTQNRTSGQDFQARLDDTDQTEKKLRCIFCNKDFALVEALQNHIKIKHGSNQHSMTASEIVKEGQERENIAWSVDQRSSCSEPSSRQVPRKRRNESVDSSSARKLKRDDNVSSETSIGDVEKNGSRSIPEKRHICHSCGKLFAYNRLLKRHIKSVHMSVGAFRCEKCPKTFKSKQGLQYHAQHAHQTVDPNPGDQESPNLARSKSNCSSGSVQPLSSSHVSTASSPSNVGAFHSTAANVVASNASIAPPMQMSATAPYHPSQNQPLHHIHQHISSHEQTYSSLQPGQQIVIYHPTSSTQMHNTTLPGAGTSTATSAFFPSLMYNQALPARPEIGMVNQYVPPGSTFILNPLIALGPSQYIGETAPVASQGHFSVNQLRMSIPSSQNLPQQLHNSSSAGHVYFTLPTGSHPNYFQPPPS